jgi:Protein of unknown function (DUF2505)
MAGCTAEVSIVAPWSDGSEAGTAFLAPTDGSRLKCKATVEFRVPLIGGTVESTMGRLFVQNISFMQRFTTEWITEHV